MRLYNGYTFPRDHLTRTLLDQSVQELGIDPGKLRGELQNVSYKLKMVAEKFLASLMGSYQSYDGVLDSKLSLDPTLDETLVAVELLFGNIKKVQESAKKCQDADAEASLNQVMNECRQIKNSLRTQICQETNGQEWDVIQSAFQSKSR